MYFHSHWLNPAFVPLSKSILDVDSSLPSAHMFITMDIRISACFTSKLRQFLLSPPKIFTGIVDIPSSLQYHSGWMMDDG